MVFVSDLAQLSMQLPPEDQSALESLHGVDAIAGWASSRAEEYQRRIAEIQRSIGTLLSIRNHTLPIHCLPTEVLMKIFEDPSFDWKDFHLQGVCRRWQSVIQSTPRFWANLLEITNSVGRNTRCKDILSICLSRSGNLPLQIPKTTTRFADLSDILFHHRQRLTTLNVVLNVQKDESGLQDLIDGGMHTLRCLEVYADRPMEQTSLTCRQDLLPCLHRLRLPLSLLSLTTIVASLINIELWGWSLDLGVLIDALTQCPALQTLTFNKASFGTQGSRDKQLNLQHLRHLTFRCSGKTTTTLLTQIIFPTTTVISMYISDHDRDVFSALPPDSPVFRTASDMNRMSLSWSIVSRKMSICLGSTVDETRGTLHFHNISPHFHPLAFWALFRALHITTLSLAPEAGHMGDPVPGWDALWIALPRVRTLELPARKGTPLWLKCEYVRRFMERQGDERRFNDLTLVWEVPDGSNDFDWAKQELGQLEGVLKTRWYEEKMRLPTLLLHRFQIPSSPPSYLATNTDQNASTDNCEGFGEEDVARLRELVDHVVIKDTPIDFGRWQTMEQ